MLSHIRERKRCLFSVFLITVALVFWILLPYQNTGGHIQSIPVAIGLFKEPPRPCYLPKPSSMKSDSAIIQTLRQQIDTETLDLFQKGLSYLYNPPSLMLSQNYDNLFGETLQDRINRKKNPNSKQYFQTFKLSILKQISLKANKKVPELLHYILLYSGGDLLFHQLVCMLSGFWMIRPQFMIFWYSHELSGPHWHYLLTNLSSVAHQVIFIQIQESTQIYEQSVNITEHKSDIVRMEVLYEFGGIYLDQDVIVVNPFNPLYTFPFTIGFELPHKLCNSVLIAARESMFIHIWHSYYRHYNTHWDLNSVRFPHALHTYFTILVQSNNLTEVDWETCMSHVEKESLNRPNWTRKEIKYIYDEARGWDWKVRNYAVHLWFRNKKRHLNWDSVKRENSMYGDMFRYILWGSTSVML